MRLFVHCDKDGGILSVAKVEDASPGLHPFMHVGEPDRAVEVSHTPEVERLDAHEIVEQYEVDLRSNRLRKKTAKAPDKKTAAKKIRKTNPEDRGR